MHLETGDGCWVAPAAAGPGARYEWCECGAHGADLPTGDGANPDRARYRLTRSDSADRQRDRTSAAPRGLARRRSGRWHPEHVSAGWKGTRVEQDIEAQVERRGGSTVVSARGEVDVATAPALRDGLDQAVESVALLDDMRDALLDLGQQLPQPQLRQRIANGTSAAYRVNCLSHTTIVASVQTSVSVIPPGAAAALWCPVWTRRPPLGSAAPFRVWPATARHSFSPSFRRGTYGRRSACWSTLH